MFEPSQEDVRRFFCSYYARAQARQALEAVKKIASQWITRPIASVQNIATNALCV